MRGGGLDVGKITFRTQLDDDGNCRVFIVGEWPDETSITPDLLAVADETFITREGKPLTGAQLGNLVRIRLANGEALYEMQPSVGEPYVRLRKISSTRDLT